MMCRVSRSGKSMTGTRRFSAALFAAALLGSVWASSASAWIPYGGPPAPPQALSVDAVGKTSVTLDWRGSRGSFDVVRYEVYANGSLKLTTRLSTASLDNLNCGTAYKLSVDAMNAFGARSAPASLMSSTTPCPTTPAVSTPAPTPPPPDTSPPSTPANLAATGATAQSVSVSWSASTDNVGVTGYAVSVNGSNPTTVTSTSYTASGLTCGTTVRIGVTALDAAGNKSGQASTSVATTACPDTVPPSTPWPIVVQSATTNTITITWPAAIDNVGVVGYQVFRGSTKVTSGNLPLTYTYTGLSCNTSYSLSVLAYDAAGNVSPSQGAATATTAACPGDTSPPTAPTNVQVGSPTAQSLTLTWSPSTDNTGVAGYSVYLGGSLAGQTSSTTYTVSGLTCGTSYTLGVKATDAAGNSSAQVSAGGTTGACPPPPSSSGAAQVAVATNGNDSSCVRSDLTKPCKTFQQAYAIAQLGDTVNVAAGTYPNQLINDVQGKTSPSSQRVTFVAQGTVTVNINLGDQFTHPDAADNLTFQGFHGTGAWSIDPGANNITFDHVQTTNIYDNGTVGYTVTNSDFGGCTVTTTNGPCDNFKIEGGATNVVLDHDTFHDFRVAPGSGEHFECIFLADSQHVTISNSSFTNCEYYDIFVQTQTLGISHVALSGNSFTPAFNGQGAQNRSMAVNISDRGIAFDDWTLTGNNFQAVGGVGSDFEWDASGTYTHFTFTGNTFSQPASCMSGATYSGNSWTSGGC
jgi:chitodextrinase